MNTRPGFAFIGCLLNVGVTQTVSSYFKGYAV
jgi:hypothetical protein